MTGKQNEFGLTDAEMSKLLNEIREFDDDIEPVSLEEVEAIESNFQAVQASPETDSRQRQQLEKLLQEMAQDFVPLPGILKRAEQLKIGRQDLAAQLRLSTAILMKLERRLIDWIPDTLVRMLADILSVHKAELYHYLQQGQDHINAAASSNQTPSGSRTQSWQEAIETSQMSTEDKEFWLNQS